ncbi:DUF262 domain-containing protein [Olivibacter jilunii]|uniref:DUF262 domain-containing protein n=1 Tax=Olivibacter jilunii TaxID=985016 RepID=UPI0010325E90|nr:DUF262 domain-containing protein [Olivibacter jilunii]
MTTDDILNDENLIEVTDESTVPIQVPFDPNLIRIRRDPFTLGELIDKIAHNEVNFFTLFQRKSDLWSEGQQSRLIESVLLRLPLPAFYFDEVTFESNDMFSSKVVWQVIDGLQRCSALKNFAVDKKMKLSNLEFLHQFNEYGYDDLPRDLQRRISQTPITVYVVEKGTPDVVKFNIFKRINTEGLLLKPQEIRHALNQGTPAKFVEELAELDEFKRATQYSIKSNRMEDRDFTTRFVSFYLIPFTDYEPDLDSFMTKGMSSINGKSINELTQIKQDFIAAMETAIFIFGDDAFRKRQHIDDRRKPINKALFEVLSVSFAKLSDDKRNKLKNVADVFKRKFIELNNDNRFFYALSSGTGHKDNVKTRFTEISRIIKETIDY